ncbi:hypothetical protein BMS3Bbin04_01589 [bacterium BMS3Bbin04]|nr:hypothetical protein BMS3Bbin04_01589 [bacterium BMS3Bbin04]
MNQHEPIIKRVKLLLGLNSLITAGLIVLLLLSFVRQDISDNESSLTLIENVTYPQNYDEPASSVGDDSTMMDGLSPPPTSSNDIEATVLGRIALVIDDLCSSSSSVTVLGLMDLPIPFTVGIIPVLAATSAIAEIAEERGH